MEANSIIWKILNSIWILVSLIPFINGFGIIYAGNRAQNRKWLLEGIIYQFFSFLPLIIESDNGLFELIMDIFILVWLWTMIRSLIILPKYLKIMATTDKEEDVDKTAQPQMIEHQFETDNTQKTITKIDINKATFDELMRIPCISIDNVQTILNITQSNNYVKSFEDLALKLKLNENELEELKKYVIITIPDNTYSPRVIDL